MADATKARSLEETPTWAVAVVCFVLVVISIFIEHAIHILGKVSLILKFLYSFINLVFMFSETLVS